MPGLGALTLFAFVGGCGASPNADRISRLIARLGDESPLVAIALPSKKRIAEHIVHYDLIHVVKIQAINGAGSKGKGSRN